MLLRDVQPYTQREWKEERSVDVKTPRKQFGEMAESEAELRKVLNTLDRDPSGMVSDFDLHTKLSTAPLHDSADEIIPLSESSSPLGSGVSPTSQAAHDQSSQLPSKRLKSNSSTPVSVTTSNRGKAKGKPWLSALRERKYHRKPKLDEGRPPVDFRTVSIWIQFQPGYQY